MYLVLGDWSDDGHGKSDKILMEVNKTVKEVQEAYKASCALTGLSFNHNEDYTNGKLQKTRKHRICTEYEDSEISSETLEILEELGCPIIEDLKEDPFIGTGTFITLWFWFVSLSLPDLEYKRVEDKVPVINGYWDENLNVQFGYGLYY